MTAKRGFYKVYSMDEKIEVRDKRRIDVEGNVKEEYAGRGEAQKRKALPEEKKAPEERAPKREEKQEKEGESLFVPFLMNLSGMAYMAMGLGETPAEPNLAEAKYIIDILGMLEKKTAGNLSKDEEQGLKSLLYELRMNFAKVASKGRI